MYVRNVFTAYVSQNTILDIDRIWKNKLEV